MYVYLIAMQIDYAYIVPEHSSGIYAALSAAVCATQTKQELSPTVLYCRYLEITEFYGLGLIWFQDLCLA